MIYRRFGRLYSRLLLYRQDELRELEECLDNMDEVDSKDDDATKKCLKSRDLDDHREQPKKESRRALLLTIERKAMHYGQLLLQAQQLVALQKPSKRDHASLKNFLENDNPPLLGEDRAFIYEKDDLVTLQSGRENAWLDGFVERALKACHCWPIQYIFCSTETMAKTNDPNIHYYTRGRIAAFVTLIITLMVLTLMVIPIWIMCYLTTMNANGTNTFCMGVLLVSTLLFSSVLSLFTKARRHEILAASAGYAAILVVFIGNLGFHGPNTQP